MKCVRSEAEPGDGIDNDCDGTADEEDQDQKDNDNDGDIDEDTKLVDHVAVIDFWMRPCVSIRGCVRPLVCPSVRPLVCHAFVKNA